MEYGDTQYQMLQEHWAQTGKNTYKGDHDIYQGDSAENAHDIIMKYTNLD